MNILKSLSLFTKEDSIVKKCVIGPFNTVVESTSGTSIVSTVEGHSLSNYEKTSLENSILNKPCKTIAEMVFSDNLLESSVGMAALNSSLPDFSDSCIPINAKHVIQDKGNGKHVAVIGHFPFVETMGESFKNFDVFEKHPKHNDFHESDIPERLPFADVVAITATTLINKSFDHIMSYISNHAFVILLGPSTPVHPELFNHGIDMISGSRISDTKQVLSQITEEIPFRKLSGIDYLTLHKENF